MDAELFLWLFHIKRSELASCATQITMEEILNRRRELNYIWGKNRQVNNFFPLSESDIYFQNKNIFQINA